MGILKASQVTSAAWWILGLALAVCAGIASESVTLLAIQTLAVLVILIARETAPWSRSLRFYLGVALIALVIRVAFRIVFNFDSPDDVVLSLPALHLSFGPLGEVHLFGRLSQSALNTALRDGLRISAILLCIGLANTLANPRRLLKSTPGALYEVATAFVIALNLAPQLITSAKRVRQSTQLRNTNSKPSSILSILVPILEDALEKSISLAASMDARGFGRRGELSRSLLLTARAATFFAVATAAVGSYFLLTTDSMLLTALLFALCIASFTVTLKIGSLKNIKTRYVIEHWRTRDTTITIASAILVVLFASGAIR